MQATPDPATYVRMGQAYEDAGKYDEATEAFDKALAVPNVNRPSESRGASQKGRGRQEKGCRRQTSRNSIT